MIAKYYFRALRSLPLVHELGSILDWICTETSLDMFMWMELDDLYAFLYLTRCNMEYRRRDSTVLDGGKAQPLVWKFVFGVLTFVGLLLALVAPIIIFSGLNPALSNNLVTSSAIVLDVVTDHPARAYTLFSVPSSVDGISLLSSADYAVLTQRYQTKTPELVTQASSWETAAQQVSLPLVPKQRWLPPPGVIPEIATMLESNSTEAAAYLRLTVSLTRPGPPGQERVVLTQIGLLSCSQRSRLHGSLTGRALEGCNAGPSDTWRTVVLPGEKSRRTNEKNRKSKEEEEEEGGGGGGGGGVGGGIVSRNNIQLGLARDLFFLERTSLCHFFSCSILSLSLSFPPVSPFLSLSLSLSLFLSLNFFLSFFFSFSLSFYNRNPPSSPSPPCHLHCAYQTRNRSY